MTFWSWLLNEFTKLYSYRYCIISIQWARGRPPLWVKISSFSCSFRKNWSNGNLVQLLGLAPYFGKSWMRRWFLLAGVGQGGSFESALIWRMHSLLSHRFELIEEGRSFIRVFPKWHKSDISGSFVQNWHRGVSKSAKIKLPPLGIPTIYGLQF